MLHGRTTHFFIVFSDVFCIGLESDKTAVLTVTINTCTLLCNAATESVLSFFSGRRRGQHNYCTKDAEGPDVSNNKLQVHTYVRRINEGFSMKGGKGRGWKGELSRKGKWENVRTYYTYT